MKIISNNDVTVYGCNFIGNNSFEGTICADTANVVHIENSLFTNNYTSWSGAAIWTHRVSKLIFVNTTITNNSTGVVVTTGSADTYFINSTFCNNSNPFSLSNDFLNSKLFVVMKHLARFM